jgi:hypothetical protein
MRGGALRRGVALFRRCAARERLRCSVVRGGQGRDDWRPIPGVRGRVQNRASVGGTAPSGVAVNDVSDTGAAIAWSPLNGAQGYTVSRANGGDTAFTPIGAVLEPSFGDMGLRPATSYGYKVTVTLPGGSEGPSSPVVTATTLLAPPRCDTPGSCPVP